MAVSTDSTLEGIERRRVQLQENVDKLRKALTHWTTWEAEYEMLKDELQSAEAASPEQIRDIARGLGNSLLNDKEVDELLGKDLATKRSANQVIDLLSRRIDYVQQNSITIEKQLDLAEKQLAGVDILLEPGVENEEGLPMMDIEEELDEEGNEISSSVNQTGKGGAEIIEMLRKAGIQKADLEQEASTSKDTSTTDPTPSSTIIADQPVPTEDETSEKQTEANGAASSGVSKKKTVAFAADEEPKGPVSQTALEKDGYNDALADVNWSSGTRVIELDQDDNEIASYPIIPQGESPEDAELRRQMLQYGLSEVGQIVAELDLDHPTVEYDDSEEDDDYEYATEDEEDEDEYGRSTRPGITEDYRQQMLELEKKLNARMLENVGPKPDSSSVEDHVGDIRTMRVKKDEQFDKSMDITQSEKKDSKKKGVRFAEELDVSEPPRPSASATEPSRQTTSTISDTIVERAAAAPEVPATPTKPEKVSRFKSARASQTNQPPQVLPTPPMPEVPAMPTGPAGRTLANTVVEHQPSASEPSAPDEFDPILLNREIQAEYHKARNKFIQRQGGFKPTEEDEESPIVEENDGKTKKVSRFMAARLKANGM